MTATPLGLSARVAARLPAYRRPTIVGLSIFGFVLFAWLMLIVPSAPHFTSMVGFDCFAYWAVDPSHPYQAALGTIGSFTYSPAFALALSPIRPLPFWMFFTVWDAFLIVNLVWLTGRMTLVWLVFLPVPLELYHGNVHILLATVCVLGFEYPALWSIGILTKLPPGVSLLWFVVRREWRSVPRRPYRPAPLPSLPARGSTGPTSCATRAQPGHRSTVATSTSCHRSGSDSARRPRWSSGAPGPIDAGWSRSRWRSRCRSSGRSRPRSSWQFRASAARPPRCPAPRLRP